MKTLIRVLETEVVANRIVVCLLALAFGSLVPWVGANVEADMFDDRRTWYAEGDHPVDLQSDYRAYPVTHKQIAKIPRFYIREVAKIEIDDLSTDCHSSNAWVYERLSRSLREQFRMECLLQSEAPNFLAVIVMLRKEITTRCAPDESIAYDSIAEVSANYPEFRRLIRAARQAAFWSGECSTEASS